MQTVPDPNATVFNATHVPAAATAAIVTIAAAANDTWVIRKVTTSFGIAAPTNNPTLIITIAGVAVFTAYLAEAIGSEKFDFAEGLYGSANQAVVATVSAPDGTTVATVNVLYQ